MFEVGDNDLSLKPSNSQAEDIHQSGNTAEGTAEILEDGEVSDDAELAESQAINENQQGWF